MKLKSKNCFLVAGPQHCVHVNKSVNLNTIKKCVKKISHDECSVSVSVCVYLCTLSSYISCTCCNHQVTNHFCAKHDLIAHAYWTSCSRWFCIWKSQLQIKERPTCTSDIRRQQHRHSLRKLENRFLQVFQYQFIGKKICTALHGAESTCNH